MNLEVGQLKIHKYLLKQFEAQNQEWIQMLLDLSNLRQQVISELNRK